jgi:signal transduction histidine kinase
LRLQCVAKIRQKVAHGFALRCRSPLQLLQSPYIRAHYALIELRRRRTLARTEEQRMSYVTILWSSAAAIALLLALVHGLVWLYDRRARANLAFAVACVAIAVAATAELGMLRATSPQEWGEWVWWMHPSMFVLVSAMALFLRLHLRAGRLWLLTAVIAMRGLVLLLNLASEPNVNFRRIDSIAQMPFLGEQVTVVASAVTGEYQWFVSLTNLLLPLFILDVIVTVWHRRAPAHRRMALLVGGPVLAAVVLSIVLTQMVIWRVVEFPMLLIPPFLIALGAMAIELSRDILRASRLAQELGESEQRLELAANAAGAGLWTLDGASGQLWATERARSILGFNRTGDVKTADVLGITDPDDAPELVATVNHAIERGGVHALQFRIALPGRGMRWIAAQGTVELDVDGRLALVRGVVRDVTHQRQAEDEADDLRHQLAHAGRVIVLGQLSSALAHELSQPLSAIQQNAEAARLLLEREPVDLQEVRAIIGDILRDDWRAAEVVHRLRAWLKQGRMRLEGIVLHELAQDVIALVRPTAAAKHVALECVVPRTLPLVFGDRVHLSQVLLNLIMNGIDAVVDASDSHPRVLIEACVAANRCCEMSVTDTGPGIPADQLDRIFEPFVTTKSEGMGIGLSISRTIVEAHGGRLWAENAVRGGATFRFRVPMQQITDVARSA